MGKIYFVSDSHLGIPDHSSSLFREKRLVSWLDMAARDAEAIYLLGDIFDFWFEYRTVVPKGFVRLLGKLAEITDKGIPVHYFTGNHDMWVFDYFRKEIGLQIHRAPVLHHLQGRQCLIGHGDGLGPGDSGYKLLKRLFSCRLAQKLFSFLHPGIGTGLALYFSRRSRLSHNEEESFLRLNDKEGLIAYSKQMLKTVKVDYFVFGHRHYPIIMEIEKGSCFVNTGDWISYFSFAEMEDGELFLKYYQVEQGTDSL